MNTERRNTAAQLAATRYASSAKAPLQRERFMDSTASLRRIQPTIKACQNGETAMASKAFAQAQGQFESALKSSPRDYAAHVRMAQCLQAQGKSQQARPFAEQAQAIYPQEAQAHKLSAVLALSLQNPGVALEGLERYERQLPGDPGTVFLKGVALEGMGQRQRAAQQYTQYLQLTQQGQAAQFAASRLKDWGLVR